MPVFSMGEWNIMDNINLPKCQQISRKIMGFPFPFVPYGATICMPRRCTITVIVGDPIEYKVHGEEPSQEEIDDAHDKYFNALKDIFDRNKAECGFPDHEIEFIS